MDAEGGPGRRLRGGLRGAVWKVGRGDTVKDLVCLKDIAFKTPITTYNEDTPIKRELKA